MRGIYKLFVLLIAGMMAFGAVKANAQNINIGDTITVKVWKLSTPPKRLAELTRVDTITDHFILLVPARSYPVLAIDAKRDGDGDNHIQAVAGLREYYLIFKKKPISPWRWDMASPSYWSQLNSNVTAVLIDPGQIRRVYVGFPGGISVSNNMGAAWVKNDVIKSTVNDIVNNPMTGNFGIELYLATDNGVFRGVVSNPTSFQATWDTLALQGENVVSVAVDPLDTSVVYVATAHEIYKYTDANGLDTLMRLDTTININKIRAYLMSDSSHSFVLAATSNGLYYSTDGESFELENSTAGIPMTSVGAIDENEILITTFGLGVLKKSGGDFGSMTWDTLDQGLSPEIMSNYVNAIAIPQSGEYYIGTEAGVYKWDSDNGMWIMYVPGISLTADDIAGFRQVLDSLETSNFIQNYLDLLNVDSTSLYDADGVPQIFVYYNYKILVGGIATQTYGDILGYYDPSDETDPDGNNREIFVINHADFTKPNNADISAYYVPYLFGKYVAWSLDHDEIGSVNSGVTLATLDSMGYYIPVTSFDLSSSSNTNPFTWPNPAFEAEADRERVYLFYEYLWEHTDFDILGRILAEELNSNLGVDTVLKMYYDKNLDDMIVGWQVANLIDNPDLDPMFGYYRIDYTYGGEIASVKTNPGDNDKVEAPLYGAAYWSFSSTDTSFIFNGSDQSRFRVITIVEDSIVDTVELDPTTNTYVWHGNTRDGYLIAVNYKIVAPGFTLLSSDMEAPALDLFTLPNVALPRYATIYAFGSEKLYTDVDKAYPSVMAICDTDTVWYRLNSFAQLPDSAIYLYGLPIELPDHNGDLVLTLWGQDISGNQGELVSDTLGVISDMVNGGIFALLGGEFVVEIPANFEKGKMVVSAIPENSLVDNGFIPADKAEEGISPVYVVSSDISFSQPITVRLRYGDGANNVGLYKYADGHWIKVPAYKSGDYIVANLNSNGYYQIRKGAGQLEELDLVIKADKPIVSGRSRVVTFTFTIPVAGNGNLSIFDVTGRRVVELYNGWLSSGTHSLTWNAADFPSGVYFYTIKLGDQFKSHKLVIAK